MTTRAGYRDRMRPRRSAPRRALIAAGAVCAVGTLSALSGCGGSSPTTAGTTPASTLPATLAPSTAPSRVSPTASTAKSPASSAAATTAHPSKTVTHRRSVTATAPTSAASTTRSAPRSSPAPRPSTTHPVIVLDPGHSPSIHAIDPSTGLNVSDYANEPEMHDVFAVALLVKHRLEADGYRVVMTKSSATSQVSLAGRAAIANQAHAALALSIHDQAGPNGGIGFSSGNNIVYYQSTGTYRATASGHRVYFTDSRVASLSRTYGQIFAGQRSTREGQHITLLSNIGYDLGSRGLAAGNIWMVQLLSHVPWIYNESGGNSPGMSGLSPHDEQRYADGLVAGVEHCLPLTR